MFKEQIDGPHWCDNLNHEHYDDITRDGDGAGCSHGYIAPGDDTDKYGCGWGDFSGNGWGGGVFYLVGSSRIFVL